jgi:hypothetical protein
MQSELVNDPNYWRRRAEEMRAFAKELKDTESTGAALRAADDYDKLAEKAERRATAMRPSLKSVG